MKNFRKTIIALATAAAMLVPSVAMAATITADVDASVAGNVYAGYYTNDGVLVKAEKGEAITAEAGSTSTLPATVDMTDVVAGTDKNGVEIRKLVFTAKADADMTAYGALFSYDETVILPVPQNSNYWHMGLDYTTNLPKVKNNIDRVPYTLGKWTVSVWDDFEEAYVEQSYSMQNVGTSTGDCFTYTKIGDRVALSITQMAAAGTSAPLSNGVQLFEFYYKVLDGQTVDGDTFKLETEIGTGTFNEQLGSANSEYGIKLETKTGSITYGAWNYGEKVADTIALTTPWDVNTKTITISDVEAPAAYEYIKVFVWDDKQIAQCDPADGTYNN